MNLIQFTKPQIFTGITKTLVVGRNAIIKQSPVILSMTAIGGVVLTVVESSKASIKANELVKVAEEEKGDKLTIKETIQVGWRPYIRVIITAGFTIASIATACVINEKRKAALAALLALSETNLKEYQDKVEEMFGKKNAQKVKDAVNADVTDDIPPWEDKPIDKPSADVVRFVDKLSGQQFWSSINEIQMIANDINRAILAGDCCAPLNMLYEMLEEKGAKGVRRIGLGDDTGWNLDHMARPYFTSTLSSDGQPCVVLDWMTDGRPIGNYRDI